MEHDKRNIFAVIVVTGLVVLTIVAAAFVLSLLGKDPLPGELIAVVPAAVTGLLAWLAPSPLQKAVAVPVAPPNPPITNTVAYEAKTKDTPPSGGGTTGLPGPVAAVATMGPATVGF